MFEQDDVLFSEQNPDIAVETITFVVLLKRAMPCCLLFHTGQCIVLKNKQCIAFKQEQCFVCEREQRLTFEQQQFTVADGEQCLFLSNHNVRHMANNI